MMAQASLRPEPVSYLSLPSWRFFWDPRPLARGLRLLGCPHGFGNPSVDSVLPSLCWVVRLHCITRLG